MRTKIDVAGTASRRRRIRKKMRPWTQEQLLSTARLRRHRLRAQPIEMDERIFQEDVVPRTYVMHRDVNVTMLPFDIDRPPIGSIVRMGQIIAQIRRGFLQEVRPKHQG